MCGLVREQKSRGMKMAEKEKEVAEGCMTFISALTQQHNANKIETLKQISKECLLIIDREEALDPDRNK